MNRGLLFLTLVIAAPGAAAQTTGAVEAAAAEVGAALEGFSVEGRIDAKELVRRAEDIMRGRTSQAKLEMKIATPRWKRELAFRMWDDGENDRSFIRILSPRKDRGTGFLQVENTLWTYLPRVERTTRIPPSMMLQSWMGSDFTNDDIVRESSLVEDYEPTFIGAKEIDGELALGVELIPHEDAPVVWSKQEAWFRAADLSPRLYLYFDEPELGEFELLRTMKMSDVRMVQGRPVPHLWVMVPLDKEGHITELALSELVFDEPLPDAIFTHENLRRSEAVR